MKYLLLSAACVLLCSCKNYQGPPITFSVAYDQFRFSTTIHSQGKQPVEVQK